MNQSNTASISSHPSFTRIRQESIDSLNVTVEQYEHQKTGAVHYHLASDSSENVFLVALRTVPEDSTGVAHILEHTALCGSERYPVRDPFFMMLRRSLNTFMNAFTSSDWTAYPFASQNRKDFKNLLDVYLDAVFFSRLDPLDFAQEGHRVEFAKPDDPSSELVFKGVVFNEMKGAMSSVPSVLWSKLCEQLFPSSTYHYNSGGDPEHIPDLSYNELKSFYESHYHPSNAIFMTFGDIPASEHQAIFEERALSRFSKLDQQIRVNPEKRLSQPLRHETVYAFDEAASKEHKTHIVIGWLLGESSDLESLLEAQLLSSVLLDNSASPLQRALETTPLGHAPSPLCGLEDSMREMVFCCGVEGSEASHADAVQSMVLEVLAELAEKGIEQERLEAVLHQLEIHQREISGDSYPYGLQLILQALGCATHYSDPIAVLNLDPVIARLRQKIEDPGYIRALAKRLLLDNPHRVTLVMQPDDNLSARRSAAEKDRLLDIKRHMDEKSAADTVKLASDLAARQQMLDDESILPKVTLEDVPSNLPEPSYESHSGKGIEVSAYRQGTNGLVYQQLVSPIPMLKSEQLLHLPLFNQILTELGVGEQDYLSTQQRQSSTVGSVTALTSMRGAVDDEQKVSANLVISSKALHRNVEEQCRLLQDIKSSVRFDETARIRELISQQRSRRDQSITGHGHGLAMTAACAGMSPLAKLNHEASGLAGIRQLRALDDSLDDPAALEALASSLSSLYEQVNGAPSQLLLVAEDDKMDELLTLAKASYPVSERTPAAFSLAPCREARKEFWLCNSQVNFCAKAYPTVPMAHSDAAALTVLGGFMRNGFLHRTIREQGGAYGGGASQDSGIAAFRFYSYRDPRLTETLADFDAAIDWVLSAQHPHQSLEEAILGVVGSIDKPSSPAGEAKAHFHNRLFGRSHEDRERFRRRVLAVTLDDLRQVTERYLQPETASTAVITGAQNKDVGVQFQSEFGFALQEL
ncbi:MAG: insulinase family protein [Pseudomonadota bacterium]